MRVLVRVKVILHADVAELSVLAVDGVQALSYCKYISSEVGAERMRPSPRPMQMVPLLIKRY